MNEREVFDVATNATSLYLDPLARVEAVRSFQYMLRLKGPSGQEDEIRNFLRSTLRSIRATEVPADNGDVSAPKNLVMRIPGFGALRDKPAILLNAHIDTIDSSDPKRIGFDKESGDFYHLDEGKDGVASSLGGG